MDAVKNILLNFPEQSRYVLLAGLVFLSSFGLAIAPSDIIFAVIGIFIGKGVFSFFPTAAICVAFLFTGESIMLEAGHRWGKRALSHSSVRRFLGEHRIEHLKTALQSSQTRIIRSIRFTVPYRPYLIFCLSSFGMDRKLFYKVNTFNTVWYVPALLGSVAFLSRTFDLGAWQVIAAIAVLWILSMLSSKLF